MSQRTDNPFSYDPLAVFRGSTSPCGLYARVRWREEGDHPECRKVLQQRVHGLMRGQLPDGSWKNSPVTTVRRLFELHLTRREADSAVGAGLEWLIALLPGNERARDPGPVDPLYSAIALRGLPFMRGAYPSFLHGAVMFLAAVFGRREDPRVERCFGDYHDLLTGHQGIVGGWFTMNNLMRAFVVHPRYAESDAVTLFLQGLEAAQQPTGAWTQHVPLYQTVNLLGHLDMPAADRQLDRAVAHLARTQNRDGSWGRTDREWNTFLVVHALKRKRIL